MFFLFFDNINLCESLFLLSIYIYCSMGKSLFILFCFIFFNSDADAQNTYPTKRIRNVREKTISFPERWSIRTNTVDWITTVPNIAVEFDVSDSVYNRWSIGAGVKFNYLPHHADFSSRFTYKVTDVRLEARRYFRSYQMFPYRSGNKSRSNRGWWRAYYVGPYVSYTRYAFQVGNPAYQGKALSAGVTGGYNIPLYETRHGGSIDLDLGLSVGALYLDQSKKGADGQFVPESRFLPYPMLTDLRVGFVYRWRSVRKKYVALNEEKILQRHTERMMREKQRMEEKYQDSLRRDSVLRVKKQIRIEKHKK